MNSKLENLLFEWPLPIIRDVDISTTIFDSAGKRYAIVNRALKKGILTQLRRGLYLIGKPFKKIPPSNFEIAHTIYGPSYISFESALFYHQWIPEAVYTTTCATIKRANTFDTVLGQFNYLHTPEQLFYLGVNRIEINNHPFLIADPWKAIADHYYTHHRKWEKPEDLYLDMRIELETMLESDLTSLKIISEHYHCNRVKQFLGKIYRSLNNGNSNH